MVNVDLKLLEPTVPTPLLALAAREGRTLRVPAGAQLFRAGDAVTGLHLLVDGAVRVTRASAGRAVTVHSERPGGLLGEIALFTDGSYPATAVAIEPSVLCFIPAASVRRALGAEPELADLLLRRMAARARGVIARLDRMAHLTVLQRLALYLVERHDATRTRTMSLGMTQVALAEELGTVKELVVRELRTLRELGLIEPLGGGRYRLTDLTGLRMVAGERRRR